MLEAPRPRGRRGRNAAFIAATGMIIAACTGGGRDAPAPAEVDEEPAILRARDLARLEPHPAFDLTIDDVRVMAEALPGESATAILDSPAVFLDLADRMLDLPPETLRLVDKESRLGADYEPADLVPLTEYADRLTLNRAGLSLRALIIPDFLAMVEAARLEGIILDVSSTYRSYSYQEWLFGYWVGELGLEEAERVSARAGSSQHQLGTTVDFGSVTVAFADHPAGMWLRRRAGEFGFSLSYPDGYEEVTGYSFEPWHFRWVSRPAARMESEFFAGIQQHMLEFWDRHEAYLRGARRARATE
ncbi:MAG: M15 family metallopeptidase [Spirochaetales bacterium]|nr:M15 family metallopeptidase [Spirochaetales bacterium]